MTSLELRSGALSARIDALGAELRSLKRGEDEFLWQNESGAWPHSAPVLFPFVGRPRGGGFEHGGRWYPLPLHGFAAASRFEVRQRAPHAGELRLAADAATRRMYPFEFALQIRFALDARGLGVRYTVRNEGAAPLAFGLGSHPAFALGPGPLTDWSLAFETEEADEVFQLDGDLLARAPTPFPLGRRLALHAHLFDADALILKTIRSRRIALVHRERGTRLVLDTGGAPQLGLWAKPGAAYVCLEPWFGVDDDADAPLALMDKPQLLKLLPGDQFSTSYRIAVD